MLCAPAFWRFARQKGGDMIDFENLEWDIDPEIEAEEERQQLRRDYAGITGDEELKTRLNNYRPLNLTLWSDAKEVDAFISTIDRQAGVKSYKSRAQLKVLLMNLFGRHMENPARYISIHRNNTVYSGFVRRYNPAGVSRILISLVDGLDSMGLIENYKGRYSVEHQMGYLSKIMANETLIQQMLDAGIEQSMVVSHPKSELVYLREPHTKKFANGNIRRIGGNMIDYVDTPLTETMRSELAACNQMLREHHIDAIMLPEKTNLGRKTLYRIFSNGAFDQGGRLYGGWWQQCEKEVRRRIRIDGEPCVEHDYKCLHGALLYSMEGSEVPEDIYQIDGFDRKHVKLAFNVLLNTRRKQDAIKVIGDKLKSKGTTGVDVPKLVKGFIAANAPIKEQMHTLAGLRLQRIDSDICAGVLLEMVKEGICCLPVHDSFVVQEKHQDKLHDAMVRAFQSFVDTSFVPKTTIELPAEIPPDDDYLRRLRGFWNAN